MPQQHSRNKRRRVRPMRVLLALVFAAALLAGIGYGGYALFHAVKGIVRIGEESVPETTVTTTATTTTTTTTTTTSLYPLPATRTTATVALNDPALIYGDTAALIAVHPEGNVLLAERNADARIYPASMTKVMTMLTFFHLGGRQRTLETVDMDHDVLSYAWQHEAACAGFMEYERVRVIDLLYGMMLPSGADAALMLAKIASGSEAAFVQEMNAFAAEMGLTNTHFTNCVGLHDPQLYSSAQDIAVMMAYAMRDPLCVKLMSTKEYVTEPTAHHPNGLRLSSTVWSRMTPDALAVRYGLPFTVRCGKTGYTDEAGQCLTTWGEGADGSRYITVIAGCPPKEPYQAVDDTMTLYMMALNAFDPPERYTPTDTTTAETTTTTAETTAAADAADPAADQTAPVSETETTAAAAAQ